MRTIVFMMRFASFGRDESHAWLCHFSVSDDCTCVLFVVCCRSTMPVHLKDAIGELNWNVTVMFFCRQNVWKQCGQWRSWFLSGSTVMLKCRRKVEIWATTRKNMLNTSLCVDVTSRTCWREHVAIVILYSFLTYVMHWFTKSVCCRWPDWRDMCATCELQFEVYVGVTCKCRQWTSGDFVYGKYVVFHTADMWLWEKDAPLKRCTDMWLQE